jgi:hypothetical protein
VVFHAQPSAASLFKFTTAITFSPHAEDGAGGYVITEDFVLAMLEEFKEQRLIHRRFAFQILLQVRWNIIVIINSSRSSSSSSNMFIISIGLGISSSNSSSIMSPITR